MAAILKGLFGSAKASPSPILAPEDADFADFAGAPDPSPALAATTAQSINNHAGTGATAAPKVYTAAPKVRYTKWYNVHERHSAGEFKLEALMLVLIVVAVLVHRLGVGKNRAKAKTCIAKLAPDLRQEFALVGFGQGADEADLVKETSPQEFASYATGRANVAALDLTVTLLKRYNPLMHAGELAIGTFFESYSPPSERVELLMYPFDGKESQMVAEAVPGAHELRKDNSAYDGFVWAVVHKDCMKHLRNDRYDVSITSTKEHAKLPSWATVMSESSEITELLLTPELANAVEQAGDLFEHLIVTDLPHDRPNKLSEVTYRKQISLTLKVPSSDDYSTVLPIFRFFLRLPDLLVQSARLRPEVNRRIRATREELIKKLRKADEDEKAESRALDKEKAKKLERDAKLKGLSAKEQKKFLEKEKEKELKKSQKRQTMRA